MFGILGLTLCCTLALSGVAFCSLPSTVIGQGLVFICRGCICEATRLETGLIDTMDCTGTGLVRLPYMPVYMFVEVCIMAGTPYCTGKGLEDHESTNPSYGMIICEGEISGGSGLGGDETFRSTITTESRTTSATFTRATATSTTTSARATASASTTTSARTTASARAMTRATTVTRKTSAVRNTTALSGSVTEKSVVHGTTEGAKISTTVFSKYVTEKSIVSEASTTSTTSYVSASPTVFSESETGDSVTVRSTRASTSTGETTEHAAFATVEVVTVKSATDKNVAVKSTTVKSSAVSEESQEAPTADSGSHFNTSVNITAPVSGSALVSGTKVTHVAVSVVVTVLGIGVLLLLIPALLPCLKRRCRLWRLITDEQA